MIYQTAIPAPRPTRQTPLPARKRAGLGGGQFPIGGGPRRRRAGLGQDDNDPATGAPWAGSPESYVPTSYYQTSTNAPSYTYTGALETELSDPFGAAESAGSQLWSDLTSGSAPSSLAQNLVGSLSQSQVNTLTQQCVSGVEDAGGSDSGQCASLVNSAVAQAGATPIDITGEIESYIDSLGATASGVSTWVWVGIGVLGFFLIYQMS